MSSVRQPVRAAGRDRRRLGGAPGHLRGTTGVVRDSVETALGLLDKGEVRVAEKAAGGWASTSG